MKFNEIKEDVLSKSKHGKFTPGWGLKLKKRLKKHLRSLTTSEKMRKEIKNLKTIHEPTFNKMVKKIKKDNKKRIIAGKKISHLFQKMRNTLKIRQRGSIKNNVQELRIQGIGRDIPIYFNYVKRMIKKRLIEQLIKYKNLKFSLNLNILYLLPNNDLKSAFNRAKYLTLTNSTEINEKIDHQYHEIIKKIDDFFKFGSGNRIYEIMNLDINIVKVNKISGSSYIDLPPFIKNKKACINTKNDDNECFKWSVLVGLISQENKRVESLKRLSKVKEYEKNYNLKFDGLEFPMSIQDIDKFERMNKINVYVLGYETYQFNGETKYNFYTIRSTKNKYEKSIDLLLVEEEGKRHYVCVKNISRLIRTNKTKHRSKIMICRNCLTCFYDKEKYDYHLTKGCNEHDCSKVVMPFGDKANLEFKNYSKMNKYPFVIYADFETLNENNEKELGDKTLVYGEHKPVSYCFYIVCKDGRKNKIATYKGLDCVEHFIKNIMTVSNDLIDEMLEDKPIKINEEQEKQFKKEINCYYCNKELKDDRVRDHDHFTGEYRGASHNECNLLSRKPNKIPIFFHNLKGYDGHLIIKAVDKEIKKINCIPTNSERYISFSLNDLEFKDSFQFMASSLDKLSKNLNNDDMKHLKQFYDGEQFDLLRQKGVFPYEWFNNIDKLKLDKLPSKKEFYSKLNDEHIKDEDYERALKVWEVFKCKTFEDYHDLYLKSDVLLLADVFENFRNRCLEHYGLDPAYYYTLPGLSWDACLKMTGQKLELLTDLNKYLMIESGIRGGISQISNRYSKANNKYVIGYDPKKKNTYIIYVDANNLYGWAMCQPLPVGGFKYDKRTWNEDDILCLEDEAEDGYIFDVDLYYPEELHDLHNDYPLAVENMEVKTNMLSDYQKELLNKLDIKHDEHKKLITNLNDKQNYTVHYRTLKLYLQLGLKIKRVNKVLTFKQSKWMKQYIEFNTEQRKKATNDFDKDFFKLANNSVFGKTMENVRNRINFNLVNDEKRLKRLVEKSTFERCVRFNDDVCGIHMMKTKTTLNKPMFVGFSILDLSKLLMYDFHYNVMKKKYGDKIKLLFTDTDSFCYEVETDDIYNDLEKMKGLFDFSNYSKDSSLYDVKNKKVLGKFKDETGGAPIKEFIGIRSKMYCYETEEGKIDKKAKGIKKNFVNEKMKIDDYRNCILNEAKGAQATFNSFVCREHSIYSCTIKKDGLTPFDDKRYLINNIDSLAYGHKNIK